MRLFVAVQIPDVERDRIDRAVTPLRQPGLPVRWVAADSLHITLAFIGQADEAAAGQIIALLDRAAEIVPPFHIEIGGVGGFPNLRRPRVIWLGVRDHVDLSRLQATVSDGLDALGFRVDERDYHPHVTLGRSRDHARPASFAGLEALARNVKFDATAGVESVDLMSSRLGPGGARYDRLHRAGLRGERPATGRQP